MLIKQKNLLLAISTPILCTTIFACSKLSTPKVECSNESGVASMLAIIRENAEKNIKAEKNDLSLSTIRATVNSLTLATKNIRTSKQDPNSTKVFCDSEVVFTVPLNILTDANEAIKSTGEKKDIGLTLEDYGLKPSSASANSYETTISYNLQPTDDGKTILATLDDGGEKIVSGMKEVVLWSMVKKDLEKNKVEQKALTNANKNVTPVENAVTSSSTPPATATPKKSPPKSNGSTTEVVFAKGSTCGSFTGDYTGRQFTLWLGANQTVTVKANANDVVITDPKGTTLPFQGQDFGQWHTSMKGKHTISIVPSANTSANETVEFCAY